MAKFLSELDVKDPDGFPFEVISPLVYQADILGVTITVPVGFKTDFASIPQILWNILPPVGRYDRAAVVHDFLYQTQKYTRAQSDATLHEAMFVLNVQGWRRKAIYAGVRVGGWHAWSEDGKHLLPV